MNFLKMGQRFIPEIQGVYRVDPIERLVRIGNLIAAGSPKLDQTLCDQLAVESPSHLDHCGRNIDAGHQSSCGELRRARERVAMPEAYFKDSRLFVNAKQFERSSI